MVRSATIPATEEVLGISVPPLPHGPTVPPSAPTKGQVSPAETAPETCVTRSTRPNPGGSGQLAYTPLQGCAGLVLPTCARADTVNVCAAACTTPNQSRQIAMVVRMVRSNGASARLAPRRILPRPAGSTSEPATGRLRRTRMRASHETGSPQRQNRPTHFGAGRLYVWTVAGCSTQSVECVSDAALGYRVQTLDHLLPEKPFQPSPGLLPRPPETLPADRHPRLIARAGFHSRVPGRSSRLRARSAPVVRRGGAGRATAMRSLSHISTGWQPFLFHELALPTR